MGIQLEPVPFERVYATTIPITFQMYDGFHTIKAGFKTDGASIPRFAWITTGTPFAPEHIRAAVIHDFLYQTGEVSRLMADGLFRTLLLEDGVNKYQAFKMFWALRIGGWWAWRRYRRQGGKKCPAYVKRN